MKGRKKKTNKKQSDILTLDPASPVIPGCPESPLSPAAPRGPSGPGNPFKKIQGVNIY